MGWDGVDEADDGSLRHRRGDFDIGVAGAGIESGLQGGGDHQEFLGERVVWCESVHAHGGDASGCSDPADIWLGSDMRAGHVQAIFRQVYAGDESAGIYVVVPVVFSGVAV